MSISYAWEKFYNAVCGMARSPKTLQGRIEDAFVANLVHLEDEIPLGDLSDIDAKLKSYRADWDAQTSNAANGTIATWAAGLSDDNAQEVARWIVESFDRVSTANQ